MAEQLHMDVMYSVRLLRDANLAEVAKWDGHQRPVDVYTITSLGRGRCNCIGSTRNPYCKHRQMFDKWVRSGIPFTGAFFDDATEAIYTPLDGEGIPVTGAVNLEGLS